MKRIFDMKRSWPPVGFALALILGSLASHGVVVRIYRIHEPILVALRYVWATRTRKHASVLQ